MDYTYVFPVVRGRQAGRTYYIAMVPLGMIKKLFPEDEEYVSPEHRAQRKLNESRIPVITKYILDNRDTYVFSALAASIDGDFEFIESENTEDTGILKVSMDARFLINDGQHRKAAIIEAINEDESLKKETIPIVFFEDLGLNRSQQLFTDLNKHAVKTSNSISELYDSRDQLAVITRNVIGQIPFLNTYTDKETDNLGKYSSNLFTLNTFYKANKRALGSLEKNEKTQKLLTEFWKNVVSNMNPWQELQRREISKRELRETYIVTQGVVIQALGQVGAYLMEKPQEMKPSLKQLQAINWRRSAPGWLQRAIRNDGRIISNNKAVLLISNVIKKEMGLILDEEELIREEQFKTSFNLKDEK